MAEPDRPKPHHYSPDFEKEGGDPEWFRAGELIAKISDLTHDCLDDTDEDSAATERNDHLDAIADEYERTAEQIDAIPTENIIEDGARLILSEELGNAADLLHGAANYDLDTSDDEFIEIIHDTNPYTEEAIIILNAIKVCHGASLPSGGQFLGTDGEYGFTYKNRFRADQLATELDSCITELAMRSGSRDAVIEVGKKILKVLTTILKGLSKTTNDPLERLFRLIYVKLEVALDIIADDYSLPAKTFQSKILDRVRAEEKRGSYALTRAYRPKSREYSTELSELEDAVTLLKFAQYIAEKTVPTSKAPITAEHPTETKRETPDIPRSIFHPYAMTLIQIHQKMFDPGFNIYTANSNDFKDRFDGFADDITRLHDQIEALDMDVIESRGMKPLTTILLNYSAHFRSEAEKQTIYTAKKYKEAIRGKEDSMDYAQALIHLLGLSRGDELGVEESFLDARGMFGNVEGKSFSAGPFVHQLKRIYAIFQESLENNPQKFPIKDKELITGAGSEIKKIIDTLAESFDSRAPEHHLQKIFRMVAYNLALALTAVTHDFELPQEIFLSKKWTSTFKQELDAISSLGGLQPYSLIDALSVTTTLLTLLHRVSRKNISAK